jgi:hydrogenase/urease accessory protein HupE
MLFKKIVLTVLLLLMAVPASAHDLPMGGSRWRFGKDSIIGNIDLTTALMSQIKGIKDGNYELDSSSNDQLQQIAHDVIQPYVNEKLSITVNGKNCPATVDKMERHGASLYTIWLTVNNVGFNQLSNQVTINYRLLFEETNYAHVNIAFAYLSDATGPALQKVFNFAPPAFQTTFDANDPTWQISLKGVAAAPAPKTAASNTVAAAPALKATAKNIAAKNIVAGVPVSVVKHHGAHKEIAVNGPGSGQRHEGVHGVKNPVNQPPVPAVNPVRAASLHPAANVSISDNTPKRSILSAVRQFLFLGIEHILTGYDHIAFLIALVVIGLSFKEVLKTITAFTLAHSITLLLAALQIVSLNSRFVESAIALSICYVAAENLMKKKVNYRWVVTFCFGLVHGFGFASALKELIVGQSNLLISVVSFNMGVEIGQLMIISLILPILYLLQKKIPLRFITAGTSAAIFLLGFTWLVDRALNLKLMAF